jgi:hypothetical protein
MWSSSQHPIKYGDPSLHTVASCWYLPRANWILCMSWRHTPSSCLVLLLLLTLALCLCLQINLPLRRSYYNFVWILVCPMRATYLIHFTISSLLVKYRSHEAPDSPLFQTQQIFCSGPVPESLHVPTNSDSTVPVGARSEVLRAVLLKTQVLWVMTPCRQVSSYRRFGVSAWTYTRRHCFLSKRHWLFASRHGVTTQKNGFVVVLVL